MYNGYICIVPEYAGSHLFINQKTKFKNIINRGIKINKALRSDEKLLSVKNIKKLLSLYYGKKTKS